MSIFILIHLLIGIAIFQLRGKLPRPIITFGVVFLAMSLFYFGSILINL
ncbi:hypothetical protein [Bacillus suaedaesalsae]|uniref:Uncharacterized protein n=1 Tax=Bacillus suaedaesalsae TaxID=2810349 RepID=A0ABS2DCT5_9BACI|nr:hypothetical protein [Bacillus suaedaesalsae]MBM6616276.1 hypothetical protein [Bacillus suaedaesalsae]